MTQFSLTRLPSKIIIMKSIRNLFASKAKKANEAPDAKTIENKLKLYDQSRKRTISILLLGASDSGKTTIGKQMRKIYETLTNEDITIMGRYIQDAVVWYIKKLCLKSNEIFVEYQNSNKIKQDDMVLMTGFIRIQVSDKLNIPSEILQLCLIYYITDGYTKVEEKNESLRQDMVDLRSPFTLSEELGNKIATLWNDVCITFYYFYVNQSPMSQNSQESKKH